VTTDAQTLFEASYVCGQEWRIPRSTKTHRGLDDVPRLDRQHALLGEVSRPRQVVVVALDAQSDELLVSRRLVVANRLAVHDVLHVLLPEVRGRTKFVLQDRVLQVHHLLIRRRHQRCLGFLFIVAVFVTLRLATGRWALGGV